MSLFLYSHVFNAADCFLVWLIFSRILAEQQLVLSKNLNAVLVEDAEEVIGKEPEVRGEEVLYHVQDDRS